MRSSQIRNGITALSLAFLRQWRGYFRKQAKSVRQNGTFYQLL